MKMSNATITQKEAQEKLWRKGILVWKLNSAQRLMYENFYNSKTRVPVFNISRRCGKTWTLATIALETAIKTPNSTVHYACPTAVMATKIIVPTIRKLLDDCPADLKPVYNKHDRAFDFKNGSKIQIEGTDEGNAERLRGTSTNLGIVDEAGFIKDLEYLVKDILLPQTLTTNGKLLLSSTPPKHSGHSFVEFIAKAKFNECYVKLSIVDVLDLIKDDPVHLKQHLNPVHVEELKAESGGENSPTWRREYMVEIITDTTHAVVPEFNDELEKIIVQENKKPRYYDAYTVMDPGLVDNTGVLFGYLDFGQAKLVIEDEYLVNGIDVTTENIANFIKSKEMYLWANSGLKDHNKEPVYMRISDNEPILLNDLRQLHGLSFFPAKKDDKEAAINDLRIKLKAEKIIINPRCRNLIYQLKTAIWNPRRTSFERTKDAGHFDLVDCIIYMVRHVQWNKNPTPYKESTGVNIFAGRSSGQQLDATKQGLKDLFIPNKSKNNK
jgi:Terminase large subunit, T4likevirus-type, N-terminal